MYVYYVLPVVKIYTLYIHIYGKKNGLSVFVMYVYGRSTDYTISHFSNVFKGTSLVVLQRFYKLQTNMFL